MVPTYQRGYSWDTEHVSELLDDLDYAHNPNNEVSEHFFGTVLVTDHKEVPELMKIIDGQQRLTTVILFLICARNFFFTHSKKSEEAKKHCERLEEYIYKGDQKRPVLVLSRTNKKLFEEVIKPRELKQALPGNYSKANDSNEKLTNAYKTIQSWIKERTENDDNNTIKTIFSYVRTLFEKFMIYKYHYEDEKKAYDVFNLVNNRGINLNESDLIKNYMFGKMADEGTEDDELDGYDDRWDEMRRNVTGKINASEYQLDRFFYHYLLTFHSDKFLENKNGGNVCLKPKNLHEKYGGLIGRRTSAAKIKAGEMMDPKILINDMVSWSDKLIQLRNPSKKLFNNNVIHYLEKIKDIKAVFVYPAILAGYKKYWDGGERAQFEALVMMCFKYHARVKVIGTSMSVGTYQEIMCKVTDMINSGNTVKEIIGEIVKKEDWYPADKRVKQNLQELRISNSKLTIALLEEVEYGYKDERSQPCVSVEHIMPKKFAPWEHDINHEEYDRGGLSAREFHGQHVSLLGNQTLLSRKKNIAASNKRFSDKQREIYGKEDTYRITMALADKKSVWDRAAIKNRQEEFAEKILKMIDLTQLVTECKL